MSAYDDLQRWRVDLDEKQAAQNLERAIEHESLSWRTVAYGHHFPIQMNGVEVTQEMADAALDAWREELAQNVSSALASYALARFKSRGGA